RAGPWKDRTPRGDRRGSYMISKLAMLEGFTVSAAVWAILIWTTPLVARWPDAALVLARALAISLCCAVSFYYNDLYDFRIVRTFGAFATRLFHTFGVAFILLGVLYAVLPTIRI